MDACNLFTTRTTYTLLRLEYGVALLVCLGLAVLHYGEIRWPAFVLLFLYIDLVGYIPGALAFRRAGDQRISKVYFMLYNAMHCLVTGAVVAALWAWLIKPEWALLAIPIHLFGDRSIFGNFLKPFGNAFEPHANGEFTKFQSRYSALAGTK